MRKRIFLLTLLSTILFAINAYAIFCSNCGIENADNAIYCYKCGKPLTGGSDPGFIICPQSSLLDGYNIDEFKHIPAFSPFSSLKYSLVKIPAGKHKINNTNFIIKPGEYRQWNGGNFIKESPLIKLCREVSKETLGVLIFKKKVGSRYYSFSINGVDLGKGIKKTYLLRPGEYKINFRIKLPVWACPGTVWKRAKVFGVSDYYTTYSTKIEIFPYKTTYCVVANRQGIPCHSTKPKGKYEETQIELYYNKSRIEEYLNVVYQDIQKINIQDTAEHTRMD